MGKPITQEQTDAFRIACRKAVDERDGYLTYDDFSATFHEEDENGESLWEFHGDDHNSTLTHDLYELFEIVADEFDIERLTSNKWSINRKIILMVHRTIKSDRDHKMTSHRLARILLNMPDLPVVCGLDRSGYGEPITDIVVRNGYPFSDVNSVYMNDSELVVDLTLDDCSTHKTTPGE